MNLNCLTNQMLMKNNLLYFFLILLLSGCIFGKKNNLQNRAFIYSENLKQAQPFFKVYNDSKTTCTLYCNIKTSDFLSIYSSSEKQNKINYILTGNLYLDGEGFAVGSVLVVVARSGHCAVVCGGRAGIRVHLGRAHLPPDRTMEPLRSRGGVVVPRQHTMASDLVADGGAATAARDWRDAAL